MRKTKEDNKEYRYFDIEKMMDTLEIEETDREKGQKLCDKGYMDLQTIDTGYIENDDELMLILEAEFCHAVQAVYGGKNEEGLKISS